MPRGVRDQVWRATPLTSLSLHLLLLLSLTPPLATGDSSKPCALYEPPAPGIHCLHGEQVLETVTDSQWGWMVELYSSWCGHCQNFAPRLKELARELEAWSDVVRVGVMECTGGEKNRDMCSKLGVAAYPTIRVSTCVGFTLQSLFIYLLIFF